MTMKNNTSSSRRINDGVTPIWANEDKFYYGTSDSSGECKTTNLTNSTDLSVQIEQTAINKMDMLIRLLEICSRLDFDVTEIKNKISEQLKLM